MRDIEFRAWVVDEYEKDGNTPKTFKMVEWFPEFFSDMSPVTGWGSDFPDPDDPCVILMLYVGLKDKNGVKIFEGDILQLDSREENKVPFFVEWKSPGFILTDGNNRYWDLDRWNREMIIIGDIYQDPELLK